MRIAVTAKPIRHHCGYRLTAKSVRVLTGQEQDVVGGGFNIEESFVGEMSQMVMFDYALSADEVAELATPQNTSCAAVYGQLLSWTDVLIGQRHGDVIIVNQSRCLGQHNYDAFPVKHCSNVLDTSQ